ncbi:hypothetical protein KUCAC02_024592, partial [Chaenocephalus aceratus]
QPVAYPADHHTDLCQKILFSQQWSALIICGVTAAVNIDNYGSGEQAPYCWMAWEPRPGSLLWPCELLPSLVDMHLLPVHLHPAAADTPEKKYELSS